MTNPVFRQDLLSTREEQQGVVYYSIEDPVAKTKFRLYEMEYLMAQKMDGKHSLEAVIHEVNASLHIQITNDDMTRFVAQLESMNFLTHQEEEIEEAPDVPTGSPDFTGSQIDPIEEDRLLTNALLQIKQGLFGHAKDYFLALKDAAPADKRHNTMINHLSIIGEEPSPADMEFIWEQIIKLYPQMAERIGAPVTMPHHAMSSEANKRASRKGIYAMISVAAIAITAGSLLLAFSDSFHLQVSTQAIQPWEQILYDTDSPARLKILNSEDLSFGANGIVDKVYVIAGQQVTKGTNLASLKLPKELQKPHLQATQKALKTELLVNEKEQAVIRNDERLATLQEKKAVAMGEIKTLGASKSSKDRATVQKLKKQLAKYNKDLAAGQKLKVQLTKQLTQAKKDDRQAQAALAKLLAKDSYRKSIIEAPMDGVIKMVNIKEGAKASRPAFTIVNPQELQVTFDLAADSFTDYQVGQGLDIFNKVDNSYNKLATTVDIMANRQLVVKLVDITSTIYQQSDSDFVLARRIDTPLFKVANKYINKVDGQEYIWVVDGQNQAHKKSLKLIQALDDFSIVSGSFAKDEKIITAIKGKDSVSVLNEGQIVSTLP